MQVFLHLLNTFHFPILEKKQGFKIGGKLRNMLPAMSDVLYDCKYHQNMI